MLINSKEMDLMTTKSSAHDMQAHTLSKNFLWNLVHDCILHISLVMGQFILWQYEIAGK